MAPPSQTRQIATRVPEETWRILQVGLLIEEAETMQELLRPVVEEYARHLAAQPEVQAIIGEVERYRDRKQGIRRLPPPGPVEEAPGKENDPP